MCPSANPRLVLAVPGPAGPCQPWFYFSREFKLNRCQPSQSRATHSQVPPAAAGALRALGTAPRGHRFLSASDAWLYAMSGKFIHPET